MATATVETKFFTFNQNNSGGSFDYDEKAGITHYVIVEAMDKSHAVSRAEDIGLYWDGCNSGRDCSCCGDRWYVPYDDGDDVPKVYDADIRANNGYKKEVWGTAWMDDGREICVHPLSGDKEWYGVI